MSEREDLEPVITKLVEQLATGAAHRTAMAERLEARLTEIAAELKLLREQAQDDAKALADRHTESWQAYEQREKAAADRHEKAVAAQEEARSRHAAEAISIAKAIQGLTRGREVVVALGVIIGLLAFILFALLEIVTS